MTFDDYHIRYVEKLKVADVVGSGSLKGYYYTHDQIVALKLLHRTLKDVEAWKMFPLIDKTIKLILVLESEEIALSIQPIGMITPTIHKR